MSFAIDLGGVKDLKKYVQASPDRARKASKAAVNGAVRFGYAESSRAIRKQVNLPQDYIGSAAQGNRLKIVQFATDSNLSAKISARQRPVSLARYAADRSLAQRGGVTVQVKPGSSRFIKSAFLIRLKAGKSISEDNFNIGLAIRLKPGQTVFNKKNLQQYGKSDASLYLVYGPSVDQVFQTVRFDVSDTIADYLTAEWLRQYGRG